MSVFVVTNENVCIEYSAQEGKPIWLRHQATLGRYLVYWNNCSCSRETIKGVHDVNHEQWIAWIDASKIVSIGFEKPIVFSGMSKDDFTKIHNLGKWLQHRRDKNCLPGKVIKMLEAFQRFIMRHDQR